MVFGVVDMEGIVGRLDNGSDGILLDAGAESSETTMGTVGVG